MNMRHELEILFEDPHIIVCFKPHGTATQSRKSGVPDMEHMILNHLAATGSRPYLAVIHRLDQPVSGILVFAKTPAAARELNRQLTGGNFGKEYLALTDGIPPAKDGELNDYMVKDGRTNTSRICSKETPGAKLAALHYRILASGSKQSLLEVKLKTGRHHQIRLQLANMGCPIAGDTKYNPAAQKAGTWQTLKLCAHRLSFRHPVTGKQMQFQRDCGFPQSL